MTKTILITPRGDLSSLEPQLMSLGFSIVRNVTGKIPNLMEWAAGISNKDEVVGVIAGLESWGPAEFSMFSNLRCISRLGVGIDNIDTEVASIRGIRLKVTSESVIDSVSEHTLALSLSLLKNIVTSDKLVREGEWKSATGRNLSSMKVGVLGLGRVGRSVAAKFSALGASVLGFDPEFDVRASENRMYKFIQMLDFDELLSSCDLITVHVPLLPTTMHLIADRELRLMKQNSYLVNTSRGGVVDETSLLRYLQEGKLAGVGLDVFEAEPYSGPLCHAPRVVMTPHSATNTVEARQRMATEALRNLLEGLA